MQKRVVIHIGFPKTGTTSIQSMFAKNRDVFLGVGVEYPVFDRAVLGLSNSVHHLPLIAALMRKLPPHLASADHAACRKAFNDTFDLFKSSENQMLLLSHETLSQRQDIDYSQIAAVTDSLNVQIIAYVRLYDEWIESLYTQLIRAARSAARPIVETPFVKRMEEDTFLKKLRAIRASLPRANMAVRSFDEARRASLLHDFLGAIDIPITTEVEGAIESARINNVRPPSADTMFLAALAMSEGKNLVRPVAQILRRNERSGTPHPLSGRRYGFLPPELKRQAREIYRRELPALRTEFGLDAPDAPELTAEELDYATTMAATEYQAMADLVVPHLSAGDADMVRRAIQRPPAAAAA